MKLLMAVVAALCLAGAAAASTEVQEVRTVRLHWTPGAGSGPLEGRVAVEPGRILRLQGWHLQAGDAIGTGWSWRCSGADGKTRTLLVTLAAPRSGVLQVTAAGQSTTFALAELARAGRAQSADGTLIADDLPTPRPLSATDECDAPALTWNRNNGAWAAWIAFDGREDRIGLARLADKGWVAQGFLPRTRGKLQQVALASTGDSIVAVWVQQRESNWDLYASVYSGGRWEKPRRITQGEGPDVGPQLATDRSGRVWLVWQCFEGSFSHIRVTSWGNGRWSQSLLVTDKPANHWAPAVATGPGGEVYIAWDSCQAGSYDVYLRTLAAGSFSPIRRISDGPEYEANASLAVEPGGRLWIAYDRGEADWGSDRTAPDLHRERSVSMRCLEGEQVLQPPLPDDADRGAAPFAEAPRLCADERGQVWIAYRRTLRENIWDLVARRFDGRAWSSPILLPDSPGRSDMRAAFAAGGQGALWLAWASDARDTSLLRHSVWVTELPQGFPAADRMVMPRAAQIPTQGVPTWVPRRRPTGTYGREDYTLYQGDLNRHTELSACHPFQHGSMLDGIRYALDVAQLDFVGFALGGDAAGAGQRFRWHLQQQVGDIYTISGTLVAFERIECTTPSGGPGALFCTGHVVSESEGTQDSTALWRSLLSGPDPEGVLAALCGWSTTKATQEGEPRPGLVAPLESASGPAGMAGGSNSPAQPANAWWLSPDARSALIAGTGHRDARLRTHLWAGYLTRGSVIQALRARHSYIGPSDVTIHFAAEGKPVGSLIASGGKPVILLARVSAGSPIRQVQVLLDGQVVETKEAQGELDTEAAVTHEGTTGADHAYAVRVICEDGSECWTTPIWVSDPKK